MITHKKASLFFISFPIIFVLGMLSFFVFSTIMDSKLEERYDVVKIDEWNFDRISFPSFWSFNKNKQGNELYSYHYIVVLLNNGHHINIHVDKDWYNDHMNKINSVSIQYRHGYLWHIDNYDIRN